MENFTLHLIKQEFIIIFSLNHCSTCVTQIVQSLMDPFAGANVSSWFTLWISKNEYSSWCCMHLILHVPVTLKLDIFSREWFSNLTNKISVTSFATHGKMFVAVTANSHVHHQILILYTKKCYYLVNFAIVWFIVYKGKFVKENLYYNNLKIWWIYWRIYIGQ